MTKAILLSHVEDLPHALRLLVLLPDFNFDEKVLGRRIWDLALPNRSDILFLGVVQNPDQELRAANQLKVLVAIAQDRRLKVASQIESCLTWQESIRRCWKPGDLIICCSSHFVRALFFKRKPLADILAQELKLPVYVLPDSSPPISGFPGWLARLSEVIGQIL